MPWKLVPLLEFLPQFAAELRSGLMALGEDHLASQVDDLAVYRCSYDDSGEAGYIRVKSLLKVNVVEQNLIGTRYGRTVPVTHSCDVYVDVDNFDRITGIEILEPASCAADLLAFGESRF